ARLFRAISYAERVHAKNHFEVLGGVRSTIENLQTAIDGENFEVEEMYPAYFEEAKFQGEKEALRSILYARTAEKIHSALYQEAKTAVSGGSDPEIGSVHICSVCGHTVVGDAPDKCPVCAQPSSAFKKF
ncbi:MAG: rubrerythrin family protein, partial [Dehalococcoidia bacterium]|nr:rubrerythrin family protein [Dehalococcoidia bacterium]